MCGSVFLKSLDHSKYIRKTGVQKSAEHQTVLEQVTEKQGQFIPEVVGFGRIRLQNKWMKAAHSFSGDALLEILPFWKFNIRLSPWLQCSSSSSVLNQGLNLQLDAASKGCTIYRRYETTMELNGLCYTVETFPSDINAISRWTLTQRCKVSVVESIAVSASHACSSIAFELQLYVHTS